MTADNTHICHVDVTNGETQTIAGSPEDPQTFALVHAQGRTLRIIHEATPAALALIATECAAPTPPTRGWEDTQTVGAGASSIPCAVVLCTTGTHPRLGQAVGSVLNQTYPNFELIVVDNAPHTGATRQALASVRDPRLRIVKAPTPGLSYARNRGVVASSAPIIAFTDDDALAAPTWLERMLEPFNADPTGRVGGTTGIVLPAELSYAPQRWFESRGGFPKDTHVRLWATTPIPPQLDQWGSQVDGGPFYPYTTARVGAGVSMAFRRDALMDAGPFDTALGAGTYALGGEDLDMFRRVMDAGWVIVHTPDAWTHHYHRSDAKALYRQIQGNGVGMAALLTKAVVTNPRSVLDMLTRVGAVARRLRPGSERVQGAQADVPGTITLTEMKGFLQGPALYAASAYRSARTSAQRRRQRASNKRHTQARES